MLKSRSYTRSGHISDESAQARINEVVSHPAYEGREVLARMLLIQSRVVLLFLQLVNNCSHVISSPSGAFGFPGGFCPKRNLRATKLVPKDFVNDLRRHENVGFLLFQRIEQLFPLNHSVKLQVLVRVDK